MDASSRSYQGFYQRGYNPFAAFVPLIVAYWCWSARAKIFPAIESSVLSGIGVLGFFAARQIPILGFGLALVATKLIFIFLMLAGAFLASYGSRGLRGAAFCFLLLLLMLPLPSAMIDRIVLFLEAGSTELSYLTFSVLGIPVLREGFILRLPGLSIEVAKECSGINSSVALLITIFIVTVEKLRTNSRRLLLILTVIPLSLVKNAIRIVTLTLLAMYVDPSFLTGRLHHQGGFVFYLIAFVPMYLMLKALLKTEQGKGTPPHNLECRRSEALPQPEITR